MNKFLKNFEKSIDKWRVVVYNKKTVWEDKGKIVLKNFKKDLKSCWQKPSRMV